MPLCHIALGGNVGDVRRAFAKALELLSQPPRWNVRQVSSAYRTAAVGERAGAPFLNAAAALETDVEPLAVLDRLQEVERLLGRVRGGHRVRNVQWGPRPIDLDLILWGGGERVVDEPRLQVPHPAAWYRRFVLDPLAEIAGEAVHPLKGLTIGELRARLLARPLEVALAGGESVRRDELLTRLRAEFPAARFRSWKFGTRGEMLQANEPALLFWLGAVGSQGAETGGWDELPLVPRLDASKRDAVHGDVAAFLRDVLHSALGEPVACE